jgi:murein DD-endopeptidase MepM/ murein hydrolase activator NlpD
LTLGCAAHLAKKKPKDPGGTLDTPPRGDSVGGLDGVEALRTAFDAADPVEDGNPSLLALSPGSRSMRVLDDLRQDDLEPRRLSFRPDTSIVRVPWNSPAGVRLAAQRVQTALVSDWPAPGDEPCVAPDLMIDCCTYTLTEGEDGSGDTTAYYRPGKLFADPSSAHEALRRIYAQVPIFLPYTDGAVSLGHGWIYNGGARDAHGSLDYGKATEEGDDPAFRVRAAGWGTVVAKYWDAWHGNVLVVEHDDAGDFEYRSLYFHLRNGKTNDIAMAKARTTATGDDKESEDKYLKFANLSDPSDLWWGTNAQAIPVDVGDRVTAHQAIAWSGNTGPGGAGAGLDTSGMPTDSVSANNHLHFMLAVRHPTWTGGEWLFVDPYGVYDQQSSGCYDLLDTTRYDRLLAPFYPYFHGVDLGVFNFYLYYYGQMGRSPATLSVQRTDDGVKAAGAFKSGLSDGWYVYDYLKAPDFQDRWETLVEDDFRLVDRSVTLDGAGVPRHNGIFRPDDVSGWFSYPGHSIAAYQARFDELTDEGFDLVDFFGYHDGPNDRIASIFAPVPGVFIHHGLLTGQQFKETSNALSEDGWLPVDVNVMEMAGGTWLAGLYRKTAGARMVHWGMTAAEYQQWVDFYFSQGWDLEVVQSYASGQSYAAIWSSGG